MRRSILNQAESSQHHSFEGLNKHSPGGGRADGDWPRAQEKPRREGKFLCLNRATPSHKVIATGQNGDLAHLAPHCCLFLVLKSSNIPTGQQHPAPYDKLQQKTSHLAHSFCGHTCCTPSLTACLQNCPPMTQVSFLKCLCLQCLRDTLFPPHVYEVFCLVWFSNLFSSITLRSGK